MHKITPHDRYYIQNHVAGQPPAEEGGMEMIGFLIGLLVGGFLGVVVMSMMFLASREDDRMGRNL